MYTESMNRPMREIFGRVRPIEAADLDSELGRYLAEGLEVERDGSIVSVSALRTAHVDRSRVEELFGDLVGYESFVNKIHLDDWGSDALAVADLETKLSQALLLADKVGAWASAKGTSIAVIISAAPESGDVVFRFHGIRPKEVPRLAHIEQYEEPLLLRMYEG